MLDLRIIELKTGAVRFRITIVGRARFWLLPQKSVRGGWWVLWDGGSFITYLSVMEIALFNRFSSLQCFTYKIAANIKVG